MAQGYRPDRVGDQQDYEADNKLSTAIKRQRHDVEERCLENKPNEIEQRLESTAVNDIKVNGRFVDETQNGDEKRNEQ